MGERVRLVAVGAPDTIFIFTDQAQEVLQDRPFVLRIPDNGQAHIKALRNERRDDDTGRLEIPHTGRNQRDALAGFHERKYAGPGRRGVDDIRREAR